MADNTTLPLTGTGDATATYADDDIGGVKYPRVKLVLGANGTNDGDVASGNPLPVSDAGGSLTVDGTVAATQSGTWTVQPGNTANTTAWKVDASSVAVPVTDNAGSLTVDAPVATPVFVRLSDGAAAISTLPVSLASVPSHAVTLSTSVKTAYVASSSVTISPASLGSDANFLAGRESNAIDNSSNKYSDYLLSGQITTGTSPTVDKEIRVYVVGISNDSTWPDVFDGTDSAETVTNAGIRDSICKLAAVMRVTATSNVAYWFGPVSVASLFGGVVPLKFVVFVTHNTAVNLNATAGNHVVSITPVYQTIA